MLVCDEPLPDWVKQAQDTDILSQGEFIGHIRSRWAWRMAGHYRDAGMVIPHKWFRPRLTLALIALRAMSRRTCWIADVSQERVDVTMRLIVQRFIMWFLESIRWPFVHRQIVTEVEQLTRWARSRSEPASLGTGVPVYLRTDLWFSAQVGGSVTHMAGVVNEMEPLFGYPIVFATARNPLLTRPECAYQVLPDTSYWDIKDAPALVFNQKTFREVIAVLANRKPAFIYQRYTLNNFSGVLLARRLDVPLVTEYNGSEVWIRKHWGNARSTRPLAERIEQLNLEASRLVVVVSRTLREELLARGLPSDRILVNPNGVDTARFHPGVDAEALRVRLALSDKFVFGFIGTFGVWHGAEEFIRAMAILFHQHPAERSRVRFLMIGDGARREPTQRLAQELAVAEHCVFTGLVPQIEGPAYLACADVLVAPHVPNADGTEFFGSPTKLFEYMAMGRPIIASRLGQIAEVIEHERTGWLVQPGDPQSLADGLALVLNDARRRDQMARAARSIAVRRHSWRTHVERIADALRQPA